MRYIVALPINRKALVGSDNFKIDPQANNFFVKIDKILKNIIDESDFSMHSDDFYGQKRIYRKSFDTKIVSFLIDGFKRNSEMDYEMKTLIEVGSSKEIIDSLAQIIEDLSEPATPLQKHYFNLFSQFELFFTSLANSAKNFRRLQCKQNQFKTIITLNREANEINKKVKEIVLKNKFEVRINDLNQLSELIDQIDSFTRKFESSPESVTSFNDLNNCLKKFVNLKIEGTAENEVSEILFKKINQYSINFKKDTNRPEEQKTRLSFELFSFVDAIQYNVLHLCFCYNVSPFTLLNKTEELFQEKIPFIQCSFLYSKIVNQIDSFTQKILVDSSFLNWTTTKDLELLSEFLEILKNKIDIKLSVLIEKMETESILNDLCEKHLSLVAHLITEHPRVLDKRKVIQKTKSK